ncbi:hypothetical protein ATANTOWER_002950 [Ataeniobius toweri]|uniref:Uncharacterized protein n=1 Tax=Ataeniobius toweri TaxID=208326 RepID=A0ABU7AVM2_9TELE|nr:hypothetical protein [Ataeniobius toweri]
MRSTWDGFTSQLLKERSGLTELHDGIWWWISASPTPEMFPNYTETRNRRKEIKVLQKQLKSAKNKPTDEDCSEKEKPEILNNHNDIEIIHPTAGDCPPVSLFSLWELVQVETTVKQGLIEFF